MKMSGAVLAARWTWRALTFGADHPATRATFGRLLASRRAHTSLASVGEPAHTAYLRYSHPGWYNRTHRKYLKPRTVTTRSP